MTPIEQKQPGKWTRGDVARVRLELEAQSDMSWVVVEDPVPGGGTVLGSGLGGQSQILTRDERREGWVWPAYEERKFDVFRAYYRFVPKGQWVVEYTVRLNNPGTFLLPATHVEAMYAPEMLGEPMKLRAPRCSDGRFATSLWTFQCLKSLGLSSPCASSALAPAAASSAAHVGAANAAPASRIAILAATPRAR
ncbi:MAG: hypothetical protein WDO56_00775 [Gammaproteobacteria bacterium]